MKTRHQSSIAATYEAVLQTMNLNEWTWQKQLRFYWEEGLQCVARMCDAEFEYTFEYQGKTMLIFLLCPP